VTFQKSQPANVYKVKNFRTSVNFVTPFLLNFNEDLSIG